MNGGYATQTLAYLGDAVFELYVREWLIGQNETSPARLHRRAQSYVSAAAQARMYHAVFARCTEEERGFMQRGRNLNAASRPKNADMTDYRHATGLETVFGFLYSINDGQRLREIFGWCTAAMDEPEGLGNGT